MYDKLLNAFCINYNMLKKPSPQRIKELRAIAEQKQRANARKVKKLMATLAERRIDAVKKIIESKRQLNNIPRFIPRAEMSKFYIDDHAGYYKYRGIYDLDTELELSGKPKSEKIISSFKKPKIRVLEVCAGYGNLGRELQENYANRLNVKKKIEYHGLDFFEERTRKVKQFDLSYDRLPKNSFDLIISQESFYYLPDKLGATQNCCDALQIGGKFIVYGFGEIYLDGERLTMFELAKRIMQYNDHLSVEATNHGLIITKVKQGTNSFPFRLDKVLPMDEKEWNFKYKFDLPLNYSSATLNSYYVSKIRPTNK